MDISVIWIRRVMRLDDNKIISEALKKSDKVYFVFVFDSYILKDFPNKKDRRLSFIASILEKIDNSLREIGSKLHVLCGDSRELIPDFARKISANNIYTEMDFEPRSIKRDEEIIESIKDEGINVNFVLDHALIHPAKIFKDDDTPYKVFTPFMKFFRKLINPDMLKKLSYNIEGKASKVELFDFDKITTLEKIGYDYSEDELWKSDIAKIKFEEFLDQKFDDYHIDRNNLSPDGTSNISPYLRFGLLSIREVFRRSLEREEAQNYVNELIWREFYIYILYHFPESAKLEFQVKYRNSIEWNYDEGLWNAFKEGKTGFPVIDASIRQLLHTGWMHNRARMIVASFLTKNMFFDWRLGEKFFAEYLMDYELSSNVGGWQWTASTGTDAQPYFRIFNPISQAQKFDPNGSYIRKYVPELKSVKGNDIFDGELIAKNYNLGYPKPIIDYKESREKAIEYFKSI